MTTTTDAAVPSGLQVDFDVYDPSLAMPVDVMREKVRELAEAGPVVWSTAQGGHWVVTGYEEAHAVLRDAETFSSWPNNLVLREAGTPMIPIEVDPPDHTAFRLALQPLFSPGRMKELEVEIRKVITDLIDGFAGKGEAEFISEFAHELPARVFLALMGWPYDDAPYFTEATDVILLGTPGGSEEESLQARVEAQMGLFGYFMKVVQERRARGLSEDDITDQIIGTSVSLSDGSRELTDQELCNMFFLLLVAGLHTVQGSLAWGVMHLAARPDQRQLLLDDPSLLEDAVEEILRIEAAVAMGRRVTRDTELGGVTMRAGDQVLVSLVGANQDPREFEEPDDLNIERSPNRHLSFGSGPHRCIGSHLARIELKIAFEELHRRIPDYRVDTDNPLVQHGSQVRGVASLPILFTPEA